MKRVYTTEYGVSRRSEQRMMRAARNREWKRFEEPFATCMAMLHWRWGGFRYLTLEEKGALHNIFEAARAAEIEPALLLSHVFHFWQDFTTAVDAAHQLGGAVPEIPEPAFMLRYLPMALIMPDIACEPGAIKYLGPVESRDPLRDDADDDI